MSANIVERKEIHWLILMKQNEKEKILTIKPQLHLPSQSSCIHSMNTVVLDSVISSTTKWTLQSLLNWAIIAHSWIHSQIVLHAPQIHLLTLVVVDVVAASCDCHIGPYWGRLTHFPVDTQATIVTHIMTIGAEGFVWRILITVNGWHEIFNLGIVALSRPIIVATTSEQARLILSNSLIAKVNGYMTNFSLEATCPEIIVHYRFWAIHTRRTIAQMSIAIDVTQVVVHTTGDWIGSSPAFNDNQVHCHSKSDKSKDNEQLSVSAFNLQRLKYWDSFWFCN